MQFKLYHYWRSSCSWRVRWAFQLKQLSCDYIPINLLSEEIEDPAFLKKNPMGLVPVLEINPGLKAETSLCLISESIAILEWLEETFPTPSLLPKDSLQKARVRQLAQIINAGTQPIQNIEVTYFHSNDPEEQKRWNAHWIRKGLNAYETLVRETAGSFSMGDALSMADLCLIPQCYNAGRNGIPLDEFPTVQRIYRNALETEPCQNAHPDRFEPGKLK